MSIHTKYISALMVSAGLVFVGCSDSQTYKTEKPVIEESESELERDAEEVADEIDETVEDAADAVTPDREIVDIDTPIGDVNVDEDRATGETKVDVDSE